MSNKSLAAKLGFIAVATAGYYACVSQIKDDAYKLALGLVGTAPIAASVGYLLRNEPRGSSPRQNETPQRSPPIIPRTSRRRRTPTPRAPPVIPSVTHNYHFHNPTIYVNMPPRPTTPTTTPYGPPYTPPLLPRPARRP